MDSKVRQKVLQLDRASSEDFTDGLGVSLRSGITSFLRFFLQ